MRGNRKRMNDLDELELEERERQAKVKLCNGSVLKFRPRPKFKSLLYFE